ncbi:BspA family leucine-rich repeat surface protein [Lachnospiraceae bacterium 45-W7]
MKIKRCMSCMSELSETGRQCPICGTDNQSIEQPAYALKCNSMLHGRYLIGKVLGQGGFGITYIGLDTTLNVKVAIKEYFPMGMVSREPGESSRILWNTTQSGQAQRQSGYDSFLKEARKMAKIDQIPSIVRVRDMFLDNETAYIVMDYVEGITLKQKLLKNGPLNFSACMKLLRPMMEDLAKVHRQGMIHRDISPDNIMIQSDGSVRLLDLGAAKDMTSAHGPSSQLVAKKGFSPFEQYMDGGKIGPWTDVYALCATIYYCMSGKLLPDALERIEHEEINFPEHMRRNLSPEAIAALKAGLGVKIENRIQSVEELLGRLGTKKAGEENGAPQSGWERQSAQDTSGPKTDFSHFGQQPQMEKIVPTGNISAKTAASGFMISFMKNNRWTALGLCLLLFAVFIQMIPEEPELAADYQATVSQNVESEADGGNADGQEAGDSVQYQEAEPMPTVKTLSVMASDFYLENNGYSREQMLSVTFVDTLENQSENAWDVSAEQNGTVMAWVNPAGADQYELYVGGEGGVQAPLSCKGLFKNYKNAVEINFNQCYDTSKTADMSDMFYGCQSLGQLDISSFDTSQVADMHQMFYECQSLRQLDVSKFDTGQVTDMSSMFWGCSALEELDLSSFDTGRVTNMKTMFLTCSELRQLDVSSFNTSQVTNMNAMFDYCRSLEQLDVNSFDTSQVTDMAKMFYYCESLKQLDVSGFDMSNVKEDKDMFEGCSAEVAGLGEHKPGEHYYLMLYGNVTWKEAYDDCIARGGYLAQINSEKEWETITNAITENNHQNYHFYLGGRRSRTGTEYYWINEENEFEGNALNPGGTEWSATHWMANEPSFFSDNEEEMYMNLICYEGEFLFNDVAGDITKYYPDQIAYICEFGE